MNQNYFSDFHVLNLLRDLKLMKGNEMYELFSYDISIIKMLHSIKENQSFEIFLQSTEFQEIKIEFTKYVEVQKNSRNNGFRWTLKLVNNLIYHRPKLHSIIPTLFEIFFKVYNEDLEEIISIIKDFRQNVNYYNIPMSIINKMNQNIDQINPNFISMHSNEENLKQDDNDYFNTIIFNDDIDKLIKFVSTNPFTYSFYTQLNSIYKLLIYPSLYKGILLCCAYGSVKCYKYFLLNGYYMNEYPNVAGKFAIIGGNYEIIQIINQNYNVKFGHFLIETIEFHRYSLTDWLIINYPSEVFLDFYRLQDVINLCLQDFNFEAFLFYYFNYCNYQQPNYFSFENLIAYNSCEIGSLHYLKYLVSHGFNIESEIRDTSLLHHACDYNDHNIIDFLISQGCNINIKNQSLFFNSII